MKTYYKNDLKRAYMILEGEASEQEDYQILMLRENEIPGILNMDVRYVDNRSQYYYDISGKTSFKMFHEKVNLTADDMKRLVNALLQSIQTLKKYMLSGKCILLNPEYIFCDSENYYFCYYPFYEENPEEEFHKLTEFFVREVNYKDEEGVRFAYTLHKATMEENYSIEEIMKQFKETDDSQDEHPETDFAAEVLDYSECVEDVVAEENLIREKDSMWESVRKFLERSSLRKRGCDVEDL